MENTGDSNIIEKIAEKGIDILTDSITGLPAPIRKNALKAFAQLCTSVIDVPVSYLEGKAKEKRAETEARIKIINTNAEQIASQMKVDPEYAIVAVQKYGQKILRERVNIDLIAENAARDLASKGTGFVTEDLIDSEKSEISEDWLNAFETEASDKSSDEMQLLFGRILAGEINRPSSYSIKTIKLISQLDNQAAKLFQLLCSLSLSLEVSGFILDARVVSISGNASSNGLQKYGLSFDNLNVLHEYGLIITDFNSYMDYNLSIINAENKVGVPFKFNGKHYAFKTMTETTPKTNLKLHGIAFTKSGKELLNVVEKQVIDSYQEDLIKYFERNKLELVEVKLTG